MYARFLGLTRGLVALESWFLLLLVLLMMLRYLGPRSTHNGPVIAPAAVRACCTQCWTGGTVGMRPATVITLPVWSGLIVGTYCVDHFRKLSNNTLLYIFKLI